MVRAIVRDYIILPTLNESLFPIKLDVHNFIILVFNVL